MVIITPFDHLKPLLRGDSPFVLLDTARQDAAPAHSFLFLRPRLTLKAAIYEEIIPLLQCIERHARKSWVAGYLSYEAAYGIEPVLRPTAHKKPPSLLGWFGVFSKPYIFSHATGAWDRPLPLPGSAHSVSQGRAATVQASTAISQADYLRRIAAIKRFIAQRGYLSNKFYL